MIGDSITDIVVALLGTINTTFIILTYWRISQVKSQTNSMHHEIVSLARSDAKKNGIIEELKSK